MTGIPRLVIAGASSGVGKTTTTIALARALRARGLRVSLFKCGPDYLDPTWHARASGAPSHNLDGWMMGEDAVKATFLRACERQEADIALIEGVMGLFDGASPTSDEGSTAEIAKWLGAEVVLVLDAGGVARTFAALAQGCVAFDAQLAFAGVVANRVGSRGHLDLLGRALAERQTTPLLGGFPHERGASLPERHLGLTTATEAGVPDAILEAWGARAEGWLEVDALLGAARRAGPLASGAGDVDLTMPRASCRIGIAYDEAFHFYYEDNLRRLEALGATLVRFSPCHDRALPLVDGLYLGGGYPELSAKVLSENTDMQMAIRGFAAVGRPIYAECGGLMALTEAIRTLDGARYPMVGLVPGEAVMCSKLQALGYVEVETQDDSPLGPQGTRFRGHQFRYSELRDPAASDAVGGSSRLYRTTARRNGVTTLEGFHRGNVVASYVHAHWASNPAVASALVGACQRAVGRG